MKPILLFSLLITVIQGFGQVDAGISSVNSPSGNICPGSITPSVTLENFGGTTLTAVDILYNIDGAPNSSYSWSGSLTPGGAVNVTLPNLSSTVGTHTFNAVTNSPNGTTDGNTLNDDGTENFTITPAINYTATVSNSNCGATDGSIIINASGGTGTLQYSVNAGITFQGSNSFINLGLGAYNVVIEDANGCQTLGIENVLSNGGPSIVTININQPTCFGTNDGSIVIAANGGGLTYSIDGGANYATTSPETLGFFQNIAPGSYSVYIKDSSGCETFQVVTLSQPDQINTLIFGNNAGCGTSNGSASVLATGGDGNFSYLWDDASNQASSSASNIPAGLYHVTVTDGNFCSVVDSVFIGNNGGPSISLASSNTICYNDPSGQISTNVSGGTAPYTYLWDDGTNQTTATAVGLNVGTYLCQVSDNNGCVAFGNASVNEPELLTGNLSVIQASCGNNNGLIISTISGGTSPYTYLWNDGNNQITSVAVSLPAGQYTVNVTDANGCVFSNMEEIFPSDSIFITSITTNSSCNTTADGGVEVAVTGGLPPYFVDWSTGDTSLLIEDLPAGNYSVQITDASGCIQNESITIASESSNCLIIPTAFSPNSDGKNDVWLIEGLDVTLENNVEIYNRWGAMLYQNAAYQNDWDGKISGKDLSTGGYFYIVTISEQTYTGPLAIIR